MGVATPDDERTAEGIALTRQEADGDTGGDPERPEHHRHGRRRLFGRPGTVDEQELIDGVGAGGQRGRARLDLGRGREPLLEGPDLVVGGGSALGDRRRKPDHAAGQAREPEVEPAHVGRNGRRRGIP